MGTINDKLTYLNGTKTAIKNAIKEKGVSVSDNDTFRSYANKISAIQTGSDTSDATATASDILAPKTAYAGNAKITGTLGTETKTVKSSTSVQTVTPTSGNLINEITVQPIDLESKNITPSTSAQTITPSANKDGISQVNVGAVDNTIDNNIIAGNIKSGVSILGVTGNVIEKNGQSKTVTPTTSQQIVQPDSGYNALNQVIVNAVTSAIDNNIVAGNIKKDVSILGVTGTLESGGGKVVLPAGTKLSFNTSTNSDFSFLSNIDFSNLTEFPSFASLNNVVEFPKVEVSSQPISFYFKFATCENLETVNAIYYTDENFPGEKLPAQASDLSNMFAGRHKLKDIPYLYAGECSSMNNMFDIMYGSLTYELTDDSLANVLMMCGDTINNPNYRGTKTLQAIGLTQNEIQRVDDLQYDDDFLMEHDGIFEGFFDAGWNIH
jgi:hypothetical protein